MPGLPHAYGSSYSGSNGVNVVQILYTKGNDVVIVQTGSMQQWIDIDEATGYARQQLATPEPGWPTGLLVAMTIAGLLGVGVVFRVVARRRQRAPHRGIRR